MRVLAAAAAVATATLSAHRPRFIANKISKINYRAAAAATAAATAA